MEGGVKGNSWGMTLRVPACLSCRVTEPITKTVTLQDSRIAEIPRLSRIFTPCSCHLALPLGFVCSALGVRCPHSCPDKGLE